MEKDDDDPPAEGIVTPNENDVLLGEGDEVANHAGTTKWLFFVAANKAFFDSSLPYKKVTIGQSIMFAVQHQSPPGRFLEKDLIGDWQELGAKQAEVVVLRFLRNSISLSSKSDTAILPDFSSLSRAQKVFLWKYDGTERRAESASNSSSRLGTPSTVLVPHSHDVLYGLGGYQRTHEGNMKWYLLVAANESLYKSLPKFQKTCLAQSMICTVQLKYPPGRFLQQQDDGTWSVANEKLTIERTLQALLRSNPLSQFKLSFRDQTELGISLQTQMDIFYPLSGMTRAALRQYCRSSVSTTSVPPVPVEESVAIFIPPPVTGPLSHCDPGRRMDGMDRRMDGNDSTSSTQLPPSITQKSEQQSTMAFEDGNAAAPPSLITFPVHHNHPNKTVEATEQEDIIMADSDDIFGEGQGAPCERADATLTTPTDQNLVMLCHAASSHDQQRIHSATHHAMNSFQGSLLANMDDNAVQENFLICLPAANNKETSPCAQGQVSSDHGGHMESQGSHNDGDGDIQDTTTKEQDGIVSLLAIKNATNKIKSSRQVSNIDNDQGNQNEQGGRQGENNGDVDDESGVEKSIENNQEKSKFSRRVSNDGNGQGDSNDHGAKEEESIADDAMNDPTDEEESSKLVPSQPSSTEKAREESNGNDGDIDTTACEENTSLRPRSPFEDTDDDSDISLPRALRKKPKEKRKKKWSKRSSPAMSDAVDMDALELSPGSDDDGPRKKMKKNRKSSDGKTTKSAVAVAPKDGAACELTAIKAAEKRGRKRPAAAKSICGVSPKKSNVSVGDRVYAEWEKDDWYFGVIAAIQRKKNSRFGQYSIQFDDGDSLEYVSRGKIMTASEYRKLFGKDPPPIPAQRTEQGDESLMTLEQLFQSRCGECVNCEKDDCGQCSSCLSNRSSRDQAVCLQKMCCRVSAERKAQPMPSSAKFPAGWKFIIDPEREGYLDHLASPLEGAYGLKILPPTTAREWYTVEKAVTHNRLALKDVSADAFYEHIGVNTRSQKSAKKPSRSADKTKPTSLPPKASRTSGGGTRGKGPNLPMSLEELFQSRCGGCVNCEKDDCGQCSSCLSNRGSGRQAVCLQKMCCRVAVGRKAQPMTSAGFPVGWKFILDPEREGFLPHLAPPTLKGAFGLKILSPPGREFYSAEKAIKQYQGALQGASASAFYEHIGAKKPRSQKSAKLPSRSADNTKPASLPSSKASARGRGPCGKCENCTKPACGMCARCTSNAGGGSQHCFQKMCYELPADKKAEAAAGFPDGWRFYFAEQPTYNAQYTHKPVPGLWILSPGGKPFRSVKAAASKPDLQADEAEIARKFYTHVGLPDLLPKSARRPSKPPPPIATSSLSKYRVVGSRVYCMVGKEGHWGTIEEKFEIGHNEHTFSVRLEDDGSLLEDLDAGSVLSEARYKSKTGRDPPPLRNEEFEYDSDEMEERPRKKQREDSAPAGKPIKTTDHVLVGKKFHFSWNDLNNQEKVVYGKVVECEKGASDGSIHSFKVTYSSGSRDIANSISNGCASAIPETQTLPASLVLGGCNYFEQQKNALSDDLGCNFLSWKWITPDMREEDFVENDDNGQLLPHLMLVLRGFKLEFSVKPSTIGEHAGNGVFLKCTPLTADGGGKTRPLELKAGELVDLGVYAPFRMEDKKLESVFIAKNFVHGGICEEWAFNAGDSRYQFDITDDVTGKIHALARKHIHAYVNESDAERDVCIHAEHDAEGSVHYLLGHSQRTQGTLVVPSDGTEREVFVNYAEHYEKVRLRKGYSFLSDSESHKRDHLLEVIENENVADVKEMDAYSAADIEACANFFVGLFSKEEAEFSKDAIERALIVAAVLQRRARNLFMDESDNDAEDDGDETTTTSKTVDWRSLLKLSGDLVDLLLGKVRDKGDALKLLHAGGNVDGLVAEVLKLQFSEEEMVKLGEMLQ